VDSEHEGHEKWGSVSFLGRGDMRRLTKGVKRFVLCPFMRFMFFMV